MRKRIISIIVIFVLILTMFGNGTGFVQAATYSPRTSLPSNARTSIKEYSVNSSAGWGNYNPYTMFNVGNCTWYAFGRAWEVLGYFPNKLVFSGDANVWFAKNKANYDSGNGGFPYSTDPNAPALGAIAVWSKDGVTDGSGGHVAVVESITDNENGSKTIQTSESGYASYFFKTVSRNTSTKGLGWSSYTFLGYIYILGNGTGGNESISSLTFDTDSIENIQTNNATISTWVSNSGTISEMGFYIGSSDAYQSKIVMNTASVAWTRFCLNYNLAECYGELSPGTTYKYKFYIISDGVEYCSEQKEFTTNGIAKISYDTYGITNITDLNAQVSAWFSNSQGYTMSSIGFYAGENKDSLQKYEVKSNYAWTRHHQVYQLEDYLGTLKADTDYVARFYVTIDNTNYYSDLLYIHTASPKVTYDTYDITNITEDNAQISAWFSNPNAYTMSSIGFYAGEDINSLQKYEVKSNYAWTRHHQIYQMEDYLGKLKAGTDYVARFYVTIDKVDYYSEYLYLTTEGHTHDYETSMLEMAGCTIEGKLEYRCECGDTYTESVAALGHFLGSWAVQTEPTCTENGLKVKKCSRSGCTYEESEIIEASGHTYDGWTVVKEATDLEEGLEERVCENCGAKEQKSIPKKEHKHSYSSVITKSATCTENGVRKYTCLCDDSYTETIDALGHVLGNWIIETETTCLEDGIRVKECSRSDCTYEESEIIDATGHLYGAWKVVKEATDLEEGLMERECINCGEREQKVIEKDAHLHSYRLSSTKEATCEGAGSKIYSCTCGESYSETIDALGHVMGQWSVQTAATCDMDGLKVKTCYREECDHAEYQIIEASGHDYGEWITLVEPTTEEEGVKERECANCGNKEYVNIEKLEEQPSVQINPFKDVKENDYFYSSVLWAVDNKITSGLSSDMFAPNFGCTRAEVVTFLWRAAGRPEPQTSELTFKDVPQNAYYAKAVLWAAEKGITSGYNDEVFGSNDQVTRCQFVTFLWRVENRPEPVRAENEFSDITSNSYYYKAVLWAVENGITAGYYQDLFAPDMSCTRCQVVSFLYRAYR